VKKLNSENAKLKNNFKMADSTTSSIKSLNLALQTKIVELNKNIQTLKLQNDSISKSIGTKKAENSTMDNPQNEEDSIVQLFQSYFACKKWECRLPFVLKPEIVKPNMESYYKDEFASSTITKSDLSIQGSGSMDNQIFKVILFSNTYYVKKLKGLYKIDWLASTGFNPIPLNIFKSNSSANPSEFRIKATIGDYYNYGYLNLKDTYWNIKIQDGNRNMIIGCYINKSTADGKKIYDILKDGKAHDLIIEIKKDPKNDSGEIAIISKVIKEGWSKE
jgi:hypothetical protein